ncbi:penicillin-binding protein 1A [Exilibacterium tricleocarpae]|uniref:Penicillin-binding protein 1A n=1 Tax=Exilibacterium tricleocarpae TaxID=2591008 RepID=A0A545T5Z5_9GAMM|nr:penicillin-binding protein 1A [Exilibacterium tricleocarpae]TQV72657.1 penicillin-binding protein 1A [Exilibacterium tricleocarpae]
MTVKKPYIIATLWLLLAGFSGSLVVLGGMYLYLSPKLPAVEALRDFKYLTPLRVYSSDQKLIGEFGEKRRTPISYEEIPPQYIQALLAIEDDQFYSHHGVSIKGLLRAVSQLLLTGRKQSGGSTITMQVARNFFLTFERTFARKFNEILLALQIERELSKAEILELYVNQIFLGNRAYGIRAAARVYYGKDIDELNLAQLAMTAGLQKAPSKYNPIVNPTRALVRRNYILERMLELDYIDEATYQIYSAEPVTASYHGLSLELSAPYVAEMARKKAVELFGEAAYTDGYQVYTTIDSRMQGSAQQAVVKGLMTYDQRHGYRGPEMTLEPVYSDAAPAPDAAAGTGEADPATTADAAATPDQSPQPSLDLENWQQTLSTIPRYANLAPAAVTRVDEQSFTAVLADGQLISVGWEQGLASARRYLSEDRRGPKPKQAQDVVNLGDVVRVVQRDELWHLTQVPEAQAALVALNPENGAIKSLVGGFDFNQSHFNRITQAARQPGSSFKPFIYTAALENGFSTASIINDAPIVLDDASLEGAWRPRDDSGKFFGPTRLRQALYRSRNLVSIRVLRGIGISRAIDGMDRYGFEKSKFPRDLSLALGSYAMTPLEIARGYAVFANGGYLVDPYLIDHITNAEEQVVYQAVPPTVCRDCDSEAEADPETELTAAETDPTALETDPASGAQLPVTDELPAPETAALASDTGEPDIGEEIEELLPPPMELPRAPKMLDDQVAFLIDSMLKDVVRKGTGIKAMALGRNDLAGKTGTTNGPKDAWFSGYNGHLVTTTWLGFDQNLPLGQREYGGSAALPIWIDFMRTALEGVPETVRRQPYGLVAISIDPKTGNRAQPGSTDTIFEFFRTDNLPVLADFDPNAISDPDAAQAPPEELF